MCYIPFVLIVGFSSSRPVWKCESAPRLFRPIQVAVEIRASLTGFPQRRHFPQATHLPVSTHRFCRGPNIFSQGLALRATYTFSKALGTSTDFSNTGIARDEQRAQKESIALEDLKARSRFDSPHSFVLGYSYVFPRWMGGFTLSGTTILRDGTPFSVENPDSPPFGNVDGERNDRPSILNPELLGISVDHPDTAREVLPRDAFDASASFRDGRGNLSRNSFRKDGTTNFNISLSRSFSVSQDQTRTILFRTELINAFNHPQFDRPTTGLADPNFGQITNTQNAGRIIQVHLRFSF